MNIYARLIKLAKISTEINYLFIFPGHVPFLARGA